MIFLTSEQVSGVTKARLANVEANWPLVCKALEAQGINSPLVQVGMAATIAAETGDFTPKKEVLSRDPRSPVYAAQQKYAPSGYYGRGYIQITWRDNYAEAGRALGLDLVGSPDLALDPDVAARVAAWFFKTRSIHSVCAAKNWDAVRRRVNGAGYQKDSASLARFMGHCQALAEIVGKFGG
jgi:putative chitinase